jgi:hypothetical protein
MRIDACAHTRRASAGGRCDASGRIHFFIGKTGRALANYVTYRVAFVASTALDD